MTRAERVCRSLPAWMLRAIMACPARRSWWAAAWIELWRREVEVVIAETATESGAHPVCLIRGIQ